MPPSVARAAVVVLTLAACAATAATPAAGASGDVLELRSMARGPAQQRAEETTPTAAAAAAREDPVAAVAAANDALARGDAGGALAVLLSAVSTYDSDDDTSVDASIRADADVAALYHRLGILMFDTIETAPHAGAAHALQRAVETSPGGLHASASFNLALAMEGMRRTSDSRATAAQALRSLLVVATRDHTTVSSCAYTMLAHAALAVPTVLGPYVRGDVDAVDIVGKNATPTTSSETLPSRIGCHRPGFDPAAAYATTLVPRTPVAAASAASASVSGPMLTSDVVLMPTARLSGACLDAAIAAHPEAASTHASFLAAASQVVGLTLLQSQVSWMPACHGSGTEHFYLGYHGLDPLRAAVAYNRMTYRVLPWLAFVAPHVRALRPGYEVDTAISSQAAAHEPTIGDGDNGNGDGNDALASEQRTFATRLRARTKTHVAFISARLGTGTPIAKSFAGIIARLDPSRFDVTVVSLNEVVASGGGGSGRSSVASSVATAPCVSRVVEGHALTLGALHAAVADIEADVAVFLEHSMVTSTHLLGMAKVAPVQAVTWGHPVTSGTPTFDDFIAQDVESVAAVRAHYSEANVVRMRSLGICFDRPPRVTPGAVVPPASSRGSGDAAAERGHVATRGDFGLPQEAHVYVCPQSTFKIHPVMDAIFTSILAQDPLGTLVLVDPPSAPHMNHHLLARLATTMPADVLARVVVLPTARTASAVVPDVGNGQGEAVVLGGYHLLRGDWHALLAVADVMLDTMPFGGGTTSLEAFAQGLPIVTLPQARLCGRQTLKYYRAMGVYDCIATDTHDYVSLAVALGTQPALRRQVSDAILRNAYKLYESAEAVSEWEEYLQGAGERARLGVRG